MPHRTAPPSHYPHQQQPRETRQPSPSRQEKAHPPTHSLERRYETRRRFFTAGGAVRHKAANDVGT
ncbi:hypothetical protein E2C01_063235 [Portunus trituberculatus]|uniref:Uncharacterized protein n=1 Tax=Portunus trituberculatus TaxID=210409 RepID=A0A5B7HD56_PORTR|nr:hypothetical protein [Portunus trituberculatus]